MEAKAVPRPIPPQYTPLWQNVQRFLVGLGSVERMTSLLIRLTVSCAVLCICQCLAGMTVAFCTVVLCDERLTAESEWNQCMSQFPPALLPHAPHPPPPPGPSTLAPNSILFSSIAAVPCDQWQSQQGHVCPSTPYLA